MAVNIDKSDNSEQILRTLAAELKHPLYAIARYAELADSYKEITETAESAMSLIDDYLLVARTEYGQVPLELEPIGAGSILHDATARLRPSVEKTELIIKAETHEPVMTHKAALVSALVSCAQVLIEAQAEEKRWNKMLLRSFKTKEGRIGVGVFDTGTVITPNDVKLALSLRGKAQMPLAHISQKGATSLAIADGLFRAVGGSLEVRKMDKLRGFSTLLPKSEQLVLV